MASADEAREGELMQKIVSLCKRRGFVFQSSEIYGGLRSAYDYGPMGVELKRNLMSEWWTTMVHSREDVVGLYTALHNGGRGLRNQLRRADAIGARLHWQQGAAAPGRAGTPRRHPGRRCAGPRTTRCP